MRCPLLLLIAAEQAIAATNNVGEDVWGIAQHVLEVFLVEPLSKIIFFDLAFFSDELSLPLVVVWLMAGALYLTIKMRFISVRGMKHAIWVTRGAFDNPHDPGEISHFKALSSALSATVGMGNIAGVALAVTIGGPGAIFWLIVAGFLGMTSKFVECTLAVKYRAIDDQGRVLGGPMRYLSIGFREKGYPRFGKFLGAWFCILCIGGSLGGGNMFQANQAYAAISQVMPMLKGHSWVFGVFISVMVSLVIIGGIKRIGNAASIIVPFMSILYVVASLVILVVNFDSLPAAFWSIWHGAFSPEAGYGGIVGVIITGFRRASFSNEAGIGSAAIAHSAVATKEPIREGIVALLEPFIDTVIICTMTGLVVVVTGAYKSNAGDGVLLAINAFSSVGWVMPFVLAVAVFLFAYATMISWCYYGERCFAYLFKTNNTMPFKILFVSFSFLGSVFSLGPVLEFSDLMILGMAFPNMLGIIALAPSVQADLQEYWRRYKSGEMLAESTAGPSRSNEIKPILSKGKA